MQRYSPPPANLPAHPMSGLFTGSHPTLSTRSTLLIGLALLAVLIGLCLPRPAYAEGPTNVPDGIYTTDQTWTAADSPYIVNGWITLANSSTLTIEPGTEVRFGDAGIRVKAGSTLRAEGTTTAPITFTSTLTEPTTAAWRNIEFEPDSHGRLAHCTIAYAGYRAGGYGALWVKTSDLQVRDCTIRNTEGRGILLDGTGITPTFERVQVLDSTGVAIQQNIINMNPTYRDITLRGNHPDAVDAAYYSTLTTIPITLQGSQLNGSPYIVNGWITLANSSTLTIEPGTEVRFGDAGIRVKAGSTLRAEGTTTAPITFTSTLTEPTTAAWVYVAFEPDSHGRLAHCTLDYGGSSGQGALYVQSSDVTVRDCTVRNTAGRGIFLEGIGITPTFERVQVLDSTGVAIEQDSLNMNPTYRNITLRGNHPDAVQVLRTGLYGSSVSLPITHNITLHGDQLNGSPYLIGGWVTVQNTSTLTIQPGTEVRFAPIGTALKSNIKVQAGSTLVAEGTASQPITFTSTLTEPNPGAWAYVAFEPNSHGRLAHCTLDYGGSSGQGALYVQSSDVTVRDCTVRNTYSDAIQIEANTTPTLERVQVLDTVPSEYTRGAAVAQSASAMPHYRNLRASGNAYNAVIVASERVIGDVRWDFTTVGIPVQIIGYGNQLLIPPGSALTLTPGSQLQMYTNTLLTVQGGLYLTGTVTAPITITGATPTPEPGSWRAISFATTSYALLDHVQISGGGAAGYGALEIHSNNVVVQNSHLHHNTLALRVLNHYENPTPRPVLRYTSLVSNTKGICRAPNGGLCFTPGYPVGVLDARYNWWGDPSGPYHPTLNPTGRGDHVSDNVLFEPWLTAPGTTDTPPLIGTMIVQSGGATIFSAGQTVNYALAYDNQTTQTLQSSIFVMQLPSAATYLGSTGNGTYLPAYHQVVWDAGDLVPQQRGMLAVQVRYAWGLRGGYRDGVIALFGADNLPSAQVRRADYQAQLPKRISSETALDDAAVQRELAAAPDLAALFAEAQAAGYIYGQWGGTRLNVVGEEPIIQIILLRRDRHARTLQRQGANVTAVTFAPTSYSIHNRTGGVSLNLMTNQRSFSGDWQPPDLLGSASCLMDGGCSRATCFGNCMVQNIVKCTVGGKIEALGKLWDAKACYDAAQSTVEGDYVGTASAGCATAIAGALKEVNPIVGCAAGGVDCAKDCAADAAKHCCTGDLLVPAKPTIFRAGFEFFGVPANQICERFPCNTTTGSWGAVSHYTYCAFGERCVAGKGCVPCDEGSCSDSSVAVARDPNAKYGPDHELLPGETLVYTITYENVGAGRAYGVFVVDTLSEHFEPDSVAVASNGEYISRTHTVIWDVGELAPKGEIGSEGTLTVSVRLKPDLPSGTVISNRAVVYFPSVPEETPTNMVVGVIRPLVALPQQVSTTAPQPLDITLHGAAVGSAPLTYTVVQPPTYGDLTGTPPNVRYTPMLGFAGQDQVAFTVSNGITTSTPAEVQITVLPNPQDTTPPRVWWTIPTSTTLMRDLTPTLILTGPAGMGEVFAPLIQIGFSEAMLASSVTSTTIQMHGDDGVAVPLSVIYVEESHQAQVLLHARLNQQQGYTLTINGVQDLVGNPLAGPYTLRFAADDSPPPTVQRVYLPLIVRGP